MSAEDLLLGTASFSVQGSCLPHPLPLPFQGVCGGLSVLGVMVEAVIDVFVVGFVVVMILVVLIIVVMVGVEMIIRVIKTGVV